MSSAARRQPSTTSLSKYYRSSKTNGSTSTSDFCNNFWGPNDAGVDVLFARMRGAIRTMDELKNFWKERASIEEDYAKRLARLSKVTLGRDEVGELRTSLDTILLETERQSTFHSTLHNQIKNDLEAQVALFCSKQAHHKKVYTSTIEKQFKQKQTQESYVSKAREKYEQDCMRINSYTAQSTLVQGRDLEKIHYKLERAQQTVQANERDFANFARAFKDTAAKWELDWKTFCDTCQDLEEDRLEFMKDNMWAYANAVSTVCVSDDESCEKMRVSLEQVDTEKEMENFVLDFATGNAIQAPPQFINFNSPDAATSHQPSMRPANFVRSSQRAVSSQRGSPMPPSDGEESGIEEGGEPVNTAGRGAGNRNSGSQEVAALTRQPSPHSPASSVSASSARPPTSPQPPSSSTAYSNASPHSPQPPSSSSVPQSYQQQQLITRKPTTRVPPPALPGEEPIDPTAETYIKVGANAYKVDLSRDPQQQAREALMRGPHLHRYRDLRPREAVGGSYRTLWVQMPRPRDELPWKQQQLQPLSSSPTKDYRNSAEMIVGPPPPLSSSAHHSPSNSQGGHQQQITAAFMQAPKPASSNVPVEGVLADYHQSLPGERKSASQSRRGSFIAEPPQHGHSHSQSQSQERLSRPPSQHGHAGVGAHGSRSPSPSPGAMVRRSPSPNPGQIMVHSSGHAQNPSVGSMGGAMVQRSPSPSPGYQQHQPRNSIGMNVPPPPTQRRSPSPQPQPQQPQGYHTPNHSMSRAQVSLRQSSIATTATPAINVAEPSWYQSQPQQQQPVQVPPNHAQTQSQYRPSTVVHPQQQQQQIPMQVPPPPPLSAPPLQQVQRRLSGVPQQQPQYQAPQQTGAYQAQAQAQVQQTPAYQQPQATGYQQQQQQQIGYQQTGYQQPQQTGYQQPQQTGYGYGGGHQQQGSYASSYGGGGAGAGYQQQRNSYYQPQQQQQQQQQQRGLHPQQQTSGYSHRSPSPQPGQGGAQYTEDGQVIQFYVQAMYDYDATIDEEFSFQAGDVIAVTATPEDGWWSGELLDEERRQPGRYVFPSNFVRLF
ncbi:formin-binding protein [Paramarasmius palmivorus]|uniref:Formin-binding protein n=1 Tax=Paramarasmius palmivorus TaxID=297713 RepID=A0AAW0CKQ5_9AGAR